MFQAYSITPATYTTSEAIQFRKVKVNDKRIEMIGNTSILLEYPGKYLVKFNGVGASTAVGTPLNVALYKNDEIVPEAYSTMSGVTNQTLNFETIINVPMSCCVVDNSATLEIRAEAGTLNLANVIVLKIW